VLPREQAHRLVPQPVPQFEPERPTTLFHAHEKKIQLAVFQATYHGLITPMMPDMVPLILDTGTSISLTPYLSDLVKHIRPVQNVTIKGIAMGLATQGIGDISYSFINDAGVTQTLLLKNCLYVP
jgi:hypothetical protein